MDNNKNYNDFWAETNARNAGIAKSQQSLAKRKRLVDALKKYSDQDLTKTSIVGGIALKNSPLAGIGQIVASGIGAYQQDKADEQKAKLDLDQKAYQTQALVQALMGARKGGGGAGGGGVASVAGGASDPMALASLMQYSPELGNKIIEKQLTPTNAEREANYYGKSPEEFAQMRYGTNEQKNLQGTGISMKDYMENKMQTPEGKNARDKEAQNFIAWQEGLKTGGRMAVQDDAQANDKYMQDMKDGRDIVTIPYNQNGKIYNIQVPRSQVPFMFAGGQQQPQGQAPQVQPQNSMPQGQGGEQGKPSVGEYFQRLLATGMPRAEAEQITQEEYGSIPPQGQPQPQGQSFGDLANNPNAIPVKDEATKAKEAEIVKLQGKEAERLQKERREIPNIQNIEKNLGRMLELVQDEKHPINTGMFSGIEQFYDGYMTGDRKAAENTDEFKGIASDIGAKRLQLFGGSDTNMEFQKALEGAGGDVTKQKEAIINLLKRQKEANRAAITDYNTRINRAIGGEIYPEPIPQSGEDYSVPENPIATPEEREAYGLEQKRARLREVANKARKARQGQ